MRITQVVVFTKYDLERIMDGEVYAFVNPGDNKEILIMTEETCDRIKEADCGFLD